MAAACCVIPRLRAGVWGRAGFTGPDADLVVLAEPGADDGNSVWDESAGGLRLAPPAFMSSTLEDPSTVTGVAAAMSSVVRVRGFDPIRPWLRSHGSGFIWDDEGHIVTNYHVVQGSSLLTVQFASGDERRAKVVGKSEDCDLAVIRLVDGQPAPTAGPALRLVQRPPQQGDKVYAAGHPGHWSGFLGDGSVAAVGRHSSRLLVSLGVGGGGLRRFQRHCAADGIVLSTAVSGQGNSGGPLLSPAGEVLGVNTWLFMEPLRVLVSIDHSVLARVAPALLEFRSYRAPTVGFEGHVWNARMRWPRPRANAYLGVRVDGARLGLSPGKVANAAGLRRFDELLSIDGVKVASPADVLEVIHRLRPGSEIVVEYRRFGDPPEEQRQVLVPVATLPPTSRPKKLISGVKWLLGKAIRLYGTNVFLQSVVQTAGTLMYDIRDVRDGATPLLQEGIDVKQLLRYALQYALRISRFSVRSICGHFRTGTCKAPQVNRSPTKRWREATSLTQCRRLCEAQATDAHSSCCSYTLRDCSFFVNANASSAFISSSIKPQGRDAVNSSTKRPLGGAPVAATCRAMELKRIVGAVLSLLRLMLGVTTDSG